jgi:hypothetical protein
MSRKSIAIGLIIVLILGVAIGYFLQKGIPNLSTSNSNQTANSSDASYTSLTITSENTNNTIDFGDTIYNFMYIGGEIGVSIPWQSDTIQVPQVGHTYQIFGVEIKVENISSNYLYDYVTMLVKPTVANYMFSTYHETMVKIPLYQSSTVDISSGIIDETNQYTFEYVFPPSGSVSATLIVSNSSQSKQYDAYVGLNVVQAEQDFNIKISVFSADSNNLIIYVSPLY